MPTGGRRYGINYIGMAPVNRPIARESMTGVAAFHAGDAHASSQRMTNRRAWPLLRLPAVALCLALAFGVASRYPLLPWLLVAGLAAYAALLWRWPSIWLLVVPAALPTFDLTPWTGWLYVAEPDLLILTTVGVLLLRRPPDWRDFRLPGLGAAALVLLVAVELVGVGRGLFATGGIPGGSDNPYLRPDNALRLAKGLADALVLLPFLRQSLRQRGTAVARLAAGFSAGLALEALAVIAERGTFLGLFDFRSGYRVVGTFSSMHVGGGFIDDYLVMSLPFVALCASGRRRIAQLACAATAGLALYAIVATFSRTAYGATVIGAVVLIAGLWAAARGNRPHAKRAGLALALATISIAGCVAAIALGTHFMRGRVERSVADLAARERTVLQALDARDSTLASTLFGMGLGSYSRAVWHHDGTVPAPTNFVRHRDPDGAYLSLTPGTALYLGQKVSIDAGRRYRLFLTLRSDRGEPLIALLCEKLLLYSLHCRVAEFDNLNHGEWATRSETIDSDRVGSPVVLGTFRRPVELSLLNPIEGTTLDIRNVSLLDADGRELLANGSFDEGMTRWYFTDDDHLGWRIDNQFVMTFFEGGALGLAAIAMLFAATLAGAARAIARSEFAGAAVVSSVAGVLACCVFDAPLHDPRLATLLFLVCFLGMVLWETPGTRGAEA